jgi:acyl-CoA reductase-like NAD-dependent aldehyde dehydrogenase
MASFTGGLVTGRAVMAACASMVNRIAVELGGKNPDTVFAAADSGTAADHALLAVFLHSGQVRSAGPAEYREPEHIWRTVNPKPQGWFDPAGGGIA